MLIRKQDNAWMTTDLIRRWIREVLLPYLGGSMYCIMNHSMLMMDAFRAHLSTVVKETLVGNHIDLGIVPSIVI